MKESTVRIDDWDLPRRRLYASEALTRAPQVAQRPVPAPIVIVGLPRTGTTHLHNLLTRDPVRATLSLGNGLLSRLPGEAPGWGPAGGPPEVAGVAGIQCMLSGARLVGDVRDVAGRGESRRP